MSLLGVAQQENNHKTNKNTHTSFKQTLSSECSAGFSHLQADQSSYRLLIDTHSHLLALSLKFSPWLTTQAKDMTNLLNFQNFHFFLC